MKPKNHQEQIIIPVYYYEDEDGQLVYDFEEMADYFAKELSKLDESNKILCNLEYK
jgi:hypothetical protein